VSRDVRCFVSSVKERSIGVRCDREWSPFIAFRETSSFRSTFLPADSSRFVAVTCYICMIKYARDGTSFPPRDRTRERRPDVRSESRSSRVLNFPHVSDFEFCRRQGFLSREQGAAIKFKFEGRGPFRACMRDAIGVSVFDMHGNDNRRFE